MFTPRYIKHSKLLLRHAQKFLRYKRDIMDTETYDLIGADIRRLQAACWPGGSADRIEPVAREWLSHWHPARAAAVIPTCLCQTGRCPVSTRSSARFVSAIVSPLMIARTQRGLGSTVIL